MYNYVLDLIFLCGNHVDPMTFMFNSYTTMLKLFKTNMETTLLVDEHAAMMFQLIIIVLNSTKTYRTEK